MREAQGSNKRSQMGEGSLQDKPHSPTQIFDYVLNVVLRATESAHVGCAVNFITLLSQNEQLLLFCVGDLLLHMNLEEQKLDFTKEELARVESRYKFHSGHEYSTIKEDLKEILVSLSPSLGTY